MYMYIHTYMHAYIYMYMHTYIHIHIHTAIGLFPDVGFAYAMRDMPGECMWMGLTGARLGSKASPVGVY